MSNQPYKFSKAINQVAERIKPKFGGDVKPQVRERVMNGLDNMRKYSNIFAQLEAATHQPGASEADWKAQIDAIIYAPMNDDAAQKLVALIELVDADAKYN